MAIKTLFSIFNRDTEVHSMYCSDLCFSNAPCAGLAQIPIRWLSHRFCREMIYSTQRVHSFCAFCTSWSVAKYCHLGW